MGLCKYYPSVDARMGAILTLAGVRQTAILEFGPMGTANYGDMMLSAYGCDENPLHFATHMTDTQIAMGDFSTLEQAIDSIREHHAPRAIFVVPSALAEITGSDIEFVCEEQSTEECLVIALPPLGIGKDESFGVAAALDCLSALVGAQGAAEANAIGVLAGVRQAEAQGATGASVAAMREPVMAATLQQPQSFKPATRTYNIIGCVPNDYSARSDMAEIARTMRMFFGAEPLCVMPWGSDPSALLQMGNADVNLVIRSEGVLLAHAMEQRFGVPFVAGRPCGSEQTEAWLREVAVATDWELNEAQMRFEQEKCAVAQRRLATYLARSYRGCSLDLLLFACYDTAKSVGAYLSDELGIRVTLLCETPSHGGIPLRDEAFWEKFIQEHPGCLVLGDASMKRCAGNRAAVISHPAGGRLDVAGQSPLFGFGGAHHVVELVWNLLHEGRC